MANDLVTRLLLNSNNFDNNIRKSTKEMQAMQKQAATIKAGLTSAFTGIGAAVGLSMGAMELFNKTIASTQTLTDAFGENMEAAKGATNEFFFALGTGDFSNFTSNIKEAIELAKEFYREMDTLGSMTLFQENSILEVQNKMGANRNIIKNKNSSKEDVAAAQAALRENETEMRDLITNYAQQANKTYLASLRNSLKISDKGKTEDEIAAINKQLEEEFGSYAKYNENIQKFNQLEKERLAARAPYEKTIVAPGGKITGTVTAYEDTEESLAIENDAEYKRLKRIKELHDDNIKKAKAYQRLALSGESQLIAAEGANIKGLNAGSTGGTGGKEVKVEVIPADGSIAKLDAEISEKKRELSLAINDADRITITKELDALIKQKRTIEINVRYKMATEGNTDLTKMDANRKAGFSDMLKGVSIPLSIKVPEIPQIETDNVKDINSYATAINGLASSFNNLGNVNGDEMLGFVGNSISQIGSMITALMSLTLAKGVSSVFDLPFPASLAAVATVVGTITSLFASFPKFATGGIVGGNSSVGDNVLARVNSGEMILNKSQQGNLFKMINQGATGATGGAVEFKIKGDTLIGAINNYNRKKSKI